MCRSSPWARFDAVAVCDLVDGREPSWESLRCKSRWPPAGCIVCAESLSSWIPGTSSLAHLRENLAAADLALSKETLAELDQIAASAREALIGQACFMSRMVQNPNGAEALWGQRAPPR